MTAAFQVEFAASDITSSRRLEGAAPTWREGDGGHLTHMDLVASLHRREVHAEYHMSCEAQ